MLLNSIVNEYSKSISIIFLYNPENKNSEPVTFSIGTGKNQISADLLSKVINYARFGEESGNSFKDILASALYNGFSAKEKQLINALKNDREGIANSQIIIQIENMNEEKELLSSDPTEIYLRELKLIEELDFKARELKKFYKKMDKISGNLPLEEMYQDVQGTNTKLSNFHITDFERLNNIKLNSPVFK